MTDFDSAFKAIEELAANEENLLDRNEAQTRLDLIDKVLNAFGWEFRVEERVGAGYTDYRLGSPATVAVVEAKREGVAFTLPIELGYGKRSLKALLSGRSNEKLARALEQCMEYCAKLGIAQGIVTNGHQWVCFIANRTDGTPPLEGEAVIISSLDYMRESFTEIWNILSEPALKSKSLVRSLTHHEVRAPLPLSSRLREYPGTKRRNELQSSLQILAELFLEDVPSRVELRERFLEQCYATSGALSQYSELSRAILKSQQKEQITTGSTQEELVYGKKGLNEKLTGDILSAAMSNKPIVLLGEVGAGKSTFIQRLVNVDAKDLFAEAYSIYVDYGSQATLSDLRQWTVAEVQRQIREEYGIDIESRQFLEDLYRQDLREFDEGIYGMLKEVDPSAYVRERVRFLASRIEDRSAHIAKSFDRIKKSHHKQIVVFLDNIDQRSKDDQNSVFLISNELAAQWPVTVFVALRPETYYESQRHGAVSGYHPRVFKIMPPRSDTVIKKRLEFVLNLMAGNDADVTNLIGYNLQSQSLREFLEMLSYNISRNHPVNSFIDNMAGGNMRRALGFVTRFIGSGHVDTGKIVAIWSSGDRYMVPEHELLRALLHGDGNYYDPQSSEIINVFKSNSDNFSDQFLMCILLSFVERTSRVGNNLRFVEVEEIYDAMQDQGFSEGSIQHALQKGVHYRLLEEPLSSRNDENYERVRVTSVGMYSRNHLPSRFSYVDAVVVDTPILSNSYYLKIDDAHSMDQRVQRAVLFTRYLDEAWGAANLKREYWDWSVVSEHLREDINKVARVNRIAVNWQ